MTALRAWLPGGRLHLQHGPIDIVIGAEGDKEAVAGAHEGAWARFRTVLDELVTELPSLRRPVQGPCPLRGVIARRMWLACQHYQDTYITPMAAVAGAVAQELIAGYQRDGIQKAWVNNGGDVALHLSPGASLRVGLCADIARPRWRSPGVLRPDANFELHAGLPVRGVATSGWRGRSLSLGIADSVTVLARTAAEADAAATVIANAVDVDAPGIVRRPASEVKDDSDLRDIPVTVDVPALSATQVHAALQAGRLRAAQLRAQGLIWSAALVCQGRYVTLDATPAAELSASAQSMLNPDRRPMSHPRPSPRMPAPGATEGA